MPSRSVPACLAVAAVLLAPSLALAIRAPEPGALLPDADVRDSASRALLAASGQADPGVLLAGPPVDPGPERRAALAALAASAGPVEVRWDARTGSPKLLFSRHGWLSKPDARPPVDVARAFVAQWRELLALSTGQARALEVRRVVPTSDGGAVVHLAHRMGGRDVDHGHLEVGVAADGRVLALLAGGVSGRGDEAALRVPKADPSRALQQLAAMAGVELAAPPVPLAALPDGGATFRLAAFRDEVSVRPVVFHAASGPRLGWEADLALAKSPAAYTVLVDDATLQPVRRASRTWWLETRGRVFANSPLVSTHDLTSFVDATVNRSDRSRLGWTTEGGASVVTSGNNAHVQDDLAGDDEATPGRQATAAGPSPLVFDFPFSDDAALDADASLTSLFYGINVAHDWLHGLGFDEPSGTFQAVDPTGGGRPGDPVLGDDRDGSGTDNANFQTLPDGQSGRMQMYVWTGSGRNRSSSFDMGVVVHEFGHGVSTRLVGGPDEVDCLFANQGRAMGEAWSDYLAASFLEDPVIGAWVSGDPAGIRNFRLDENPPTGKDYRDFCGFANDLPPRYCEEHDNGEIWSGLLWRIREEYVAIHGADGARLVDRLVVDAMKYTPCTPSMLDARDALVLADRLATGGQHECLIKSVARERHMGALATSDGGADSAPVADATQWPECVTRGVARFDRTDLEAGQPLALYGCTDRWGLLVTDGNVPVGGPVAVTVTTGAGDAETVALAAGDGPGTWVGTLAGVRAVPNPGDGVLQVSDGELVTMTYADASPAGVAAVEARVACTPRLAIGGHQLSAATCDADVVAGYGELPGFLDRNEAADLAVTITSSMPQAVSGTVTLSVDRPDLVTLMPSRPLPLRIAPSLGETPARSVVTVRVVGSDTVAGGVAVVSARVEADGFDPLVLAFPLELERDYVSVPGVQAGHDVEGEVAPVGPEWTTGISRPGGNQWGVVTCQNTTPAGMRSYHLGPATCAAGRYSDAQGDPWLAAPALDVFTADTRAARVTEAQWQNDVTMGVTGGGPFPLAIDADAVAVTLTNTPGDLDSRDPFAVFARALAIYARIDIPGLLTIDENTVGFELDQRPVPPEVASAVDMRLPTFLTWTFLPDITIVQPPFEAQAEGYYLDDVLVTYERIDAAPQAASCAPDAAPFAYPRVTAPAGGVPCGGEPVTLDASWSEAANCGPLAVLESRFLAGGVPVACASDAAGTTPRVQDVDGWGTDPVCFAFPAADTTYVLEVRCTTSPAITDARPIDVRVSGGAIVAVATPAAGCGAGPAAITLEAAGSSVLGCAGGLEFRFEDPTGGALDCDGDGTPDDFGPSSACDLDVVGVAQDVVVAVRCAASPACVLTETVTIPVVVVTADAALASPPPGGAFCPGSDVTFTAGASAVTGCPGAVEYRWTTDSGFDGGWTAAPDLTRPAGADTMAQVEVRCDAFPSCTDRAQVGYALRAGDVTLAPLPQPADCVGDPLVLSAASTGVTCDPGAAIEYRFLRGGAPIACAGRTQDVDGWGTDPACATTQVAGASLVETQVRCTTDLACVIDVAGHVFAPTDGVPVGTVLGTLRAAKSAAGCPAGGDVMLSWADTDHVPETFVVSRGDEPLLGTPVRAPADGTAHRDAGVACDGGGAPYRGVAVYFYQLNLRNACTGAVIP